MPLAGNASANFGGNSLRQFERPSLGNSLCSSLKMIAVLRQSGLQPAAMLSRPFSPLRLRAENVRDNGWMISTLVAAP
jgi:hypothetical protein